MLRHHQWRNKLAKLISGKRYKIEWSHVSIGEVRLLFSSKANGLLLPESCLRPRKAFCFAPRTEERPLWNTCQPHHNPSDHIAWWGCKTFVPEQIWFPHFIVFHILVLPSFRLSWGLYELKNHDFATSALCASTLTCCGLLNYQKCIYRSRHTSISTEICIQRSSEKTTQ